MGSRTHRAVPVAEQLHVEDTTIRQVRRLVHRGWLKWLLTAALGAIVGLIAGIGIQSRSNGGPRMAPAAFATVDPTADASVTLSPGLIATLIQRASDHGETPVPIKSVQVAVQDGWLVIKGDMLILDQHVNATVTLQPVVEQDRLRMHLVRAQLGPVPIPGDIQRLAEGPINDRLKSMLDDLGAVPTGVSTGPRGLTVTAHLRGNASPSPTPAASPHAAKRSLDAVRHPFRPARE